RGPLRVAGRSVWRPAPVDQPGCGLVLVNGLPGARGLAAAHGRAATRLLAGAALSFWHVPSGGFPGIVPCDRRLDARSRTGDGPGAGLDGQPPRGCDDPPTAGAVICLLGHLAHAVLDPGRRWHPLVPRL